MESAELSGERNMIELTEIDRRITQADHEVRAAWLRLAPQVSGVAAYVHNVGSLFSPLDSGYVGGVASWDLWDWGVTTSGISSAKARREQTRVARAKVDEQVRLEVREAFVSVASAREATAVAEASMAAAEENFRLVHKRYDASSATSFDVVDAEAVLTQARGQRQTALYDLLIARAALRRAMGHTPDQISEP
jgi:outer membrane protein TolC